MRLVLGIKNISAIEKYFINSNDPETGIFSGLISQCITHSTFIKTMNDLFINNNQWCAPAT